jgi:hypothetical protein
MMHHTVTEESCRCLCAFCAGGRHSFVLLWPRLPFAALFRYKTLLLRRSYRSRRVVSFRFPCLFYCCCCCCCCNFRVHRLLISPSTYYRRGQIRRIVFLVFLFAVDLVARVVNIITVICISTTQGLGLVIWLR